MKTYKSICTLVSSHVCTHIHLISTCSCTDALICVCVFFKAHATSTPARELCPYQIGATKNISPLPATLFPHSALYPSLHSDHYILASLHSNLWLPHAQQVNSPVLQGKPKSPDFQTSAQSCSWSLRYLSAGLRKTLNCLLLQNYHVTQFLLGLDPVLPSATNMS